VLSPLLLATIKFLEHLVGRRGEILIGRQVVWTSRRTPKQLGQHKLPLCLRQRVELSHELLGGLGHGFRVAQTSAESSAVIFRGLTPRFSRGALVPEIFRKMITRRRLQALVSWLALEPGSL
jgi:hypothetical protein